MATYTFENMTQAQASSLAPGDVINFAHPSRSAFNVVLSGDGPGDVYLLSGTKGLLFNPVTLQSVIDSRNLIFVDGSVFLAGLAPGAADTLTGGTTNDRINGGSGNDALFGNAGTDLLNGDTGQDTLTGGQGIDLFTFYAGDAALGGPNGGYAVDTVLDFEAGTDKIRLGLSSGIAAEDLIQPPSGRIFGSVAEGLAYAQQAIDSRPGTIEVVPVGIGSDSYVFYADIPGGPINAGVRIVGVSPDRLTSDDFIVPASLLAPPAPNASLPITGGAGHDDLRGAAGADMINGLAGHDNIFGGGGDDSLEGGDGNDHLYGFDISGDPAADGDDTIRAGAGSDYIQGNAGDDQIYGDDGNDRLNGGAGGDNIQGGNGNDSINGNKGRDYIYAGTGNDTLRGGQGNDEMAGEEGNDVLFGDLGDDNIYGEDGHDTVAGGQGSDVFGFFSGDASYAGAITADVIDTITDFEDGTDRFGIGLSTAIGTTQGDVLRAAAGISFTTVAEALFIAQQLLDGHLGTSDVAALQVGTDSYLFYNDSEGSTVNSIIRVIGLAPSNISEADFAMLGSGSGSSDIAVAA